MFRCCRSGGAGVEGREEERGVGDGDGVGVVGVVHTGVGTETIGMERVICGAFLLRADAG